MTCVRTGFHAFLVPEQCWVYGDAFQFGGYFLFRICEISPGPIRGRKQYQIETYDTWFDERATSQRHNSTMLAKVRDVGEFGYDGVPC